MRARSVLGPSVCLAMGLSLAVLGCDKKSSPSPTTPSASSGPTVSYVYVSGGAPATGASSQFTATAILSDGVNANVTSQAVWKTSNPSILTVSAAGVVTGVAAGTADISATYQGLTGTTPVTVSTLPCQFVVQPTQVWVPQEGGSAQITVTMTMGVGCAWTAQTTQPFVTITGGASGTGSGVVAVTIAPNTGTSRSGTLTVAGTAVAITQGQADCVTGVTPPTVNFSAMGGTGTLTVAAPNGCTWAASSSSPFVSIIGSPTGIGNGSLQYTVGPNATGAARQGAIVVERFQQTVTQGVATGGTYLMFTSDPGDYIGQGRSWLYMTPDAVFTPYMGASNHVEITVRGADGSRAVTWSLQMQAPSGAPLAPGNYENAYRWPFQAPNSPGLSLYGDGRGCNQLSGRFEVREAVYGPGPSLVRFWASFEQHCEFRTPASRGEISFGR